MFKSQLEPPSENFVETQIFVENIFDTVKKAREAKAARSLAESKLAHYDYSFDFSPSKRKKTRKNAKAKASKAGKNKVTPKKKPRKPRTPKDSAEKKKKTPTTPKTPRKYTKRAKVKPQNDIDDEEAAFILSSISQRSFDSFYNRLNGSTHVVQKIQIPLEVPEPAVQETPKQPPESSHLTAYHYVMLDHNYWIVEPPAPQTTSVTSTTSEEPQNNNNNNINNNNDNITNNNNNNNNNSNNMNLLLTVASSQCTQNSTNSSMKVEVNNNKLPLLDVNCETPKLPMANGDNAVKKRWLRQATTECSPTTVTPPEMSPNDMKAPLKKRRVILEMDDNNEINGKVGVCSETELSKIDQTMNSFRNHVEAIKFSGNENFVHKATDGVNSSLRDVHDAQYANNLVVVKEEPRSVIQSPIGHQLIHGLKNNLTYGIQMSSPVDVNAIYGRSQVDVLKVDVQKEQARNAHGNEMKLLKQTQPIYDGKVIKIESDRSHDFRSTNANIVDSKYKDRFSPVVGIKTEVLDNMHHVVKTENYENKAIKVEVDGKLQQILDGKIQRIYRDNSPYFADHADQKMNQNYGKFYDKVTEPVHQMSVIQGMNPNENSYRNQFENHILINTGNATNDKAAPCLLQRVTENFTEPKVYSENYPKVHQASSPTKIGQLKGFSSPTKIQISPTRTYEIYAKNPNENIAESLLKLQQESPVKLLQLSPAKVIQSPTNFQVPQSEMVVDHGYLKAESKKVKNVQKATKTVKVKPAKVKKIPAKVKKAQQPKQKKIKAPKSPSKAKASKKNAKVDKNLIKNFTNLEDVPLKIRQNLSMNEEILMKLSPSGSNEIKPPVISNCNHLIPQIDIDKPQIFEKCNKIFNDIENQKLSKRTISESSSGSAKSSTKSKAIKTSAKSLPKKLKFEDSGSEKDVELKMRNLMENIDIQKPAESPNIIASKIIESLIPKKLNFDDDALAGPSFTGGNGQSLAMDEVDSIKEHGRMKKLSESEKFLLPPRNLIIGNRHLDVDHPKCSNDLDFKSTENKIINGPKISPTALSLGTKSSQDISNVKSQCQTSFSQDIESSDAKLDLTCSEIFKQDDNVDNDSDTDTADSMGSDSENDKNSKKISSINKEFDVIVNTKSAVIKTISKATIEEAASEIDKNCNSIKVSINDDLPDKHDENIILQCAVKLVEHTNSSMKIASDSQKPIKIDVKASNKLQPSDAIEEMKSNCIVEIQDSSNKVLENSSELCKSVDKSNQACEKICLAVDKNSLDKKSHLSTENSCAASEKLITDPKKVDELKFIQQSDMETIEQKPTATANDTENQRKITELESQKSPSEQKSTPSTNSDELESEKSSLKAIDSLVPTLSLQVTTNIVRLPLDASSSLSVDPLISPIKPEVVEQQVASILEKVIPKTLKTDFSKEIEVLEVKMDQNEPQTDPVSDVEDEDDTPYRESVEEFHKDTLEKLMQANKRFCRENVVHNPFKHSVSYDGRESGRYSKSDDYHSSRNRGYDYDDHQKPLKMSLSFDSHQQYQHQGYPPQYQRSVSEVLNDPRKERWCGNGIYENRNYGSFHYDKIHHREPITTTYSMYRAQKASQMDSRWSNRQPYEYQQEPQHKTNNYLPEKPQIVPQPQPTTPTVINNYRTTQPESIRSEPVPLAVSPQAEALKNATSDAFSGFIKEKLNATPPILPKTKTASSDPRLNPSLVQDIKKDEPATPKKKLSLDQYRKRKSLTTIPQVSSSDENAPSTSFSESPSPTLPPAFDPTIAAAAATG